MDDIDSLVDAQIRRGDTTRTWCDTHTTEFHRRNGCPEFGLPPANHWTQEPSQVKRLLHRFRTRH